MSITAYQTCNPSLWNATATWKENGVVRMFNGEGRTEAEARANLKSRLPHDSPAERSVAPAYTTVGFLLIALSLSTPALAQEPHAGPLVDGSLLQDIREARQDVRDLRKSIVEGSGVVQGIGERWDKRLDRWEAGEGPFAKFLDRIGNALLLICGTVAFVALCLAPFGVAAVIRQLRAKA